MTQLKKVEKINVNHVYFDCPHCDAQQDGWLSDPRGKDHECEDCGEHYHVPADVKLDF